MKASLRHVLVLLAGTVAGCVQGPAPGDAPAVRNAPPRPAASRSGPAVPYRVEGACPFECCTYGAWTAGETLNAYVAPGDMTAVAFAIPAGTTFDADTGFVAVTQTGLVVVDRPTEVYRGYGERRTVEDGDTLYAFDYVGEGAYNVWFADSVYQLPSPYSAAPPAEVGPAYRSLRDPVQTWWAHAVLADGRAGWLWMDEHEGDAVRGVDACGAD